MSGSKGSKHDLTEDDSASDSGQSSNSSASTRQLDLWVPADDESTGHFDKTESKVNLAHFGALCRHCTEKKVRPTKGAKRGTKFSHVSLDHFVEDMLIILVNLQRAAVSITVLARKKTCCCTSAIVPMHLRQQGMMPYGSL